MAIFSMDNIPVLYEDNHIIVVVKPQNLPTQADASGDEDLLSIVKEYLKVKYEKSGEAFLGLVHRLDRVTGGIVVLARTSKAAQRLSKMFVDGEIEKKYFAVVLNSLKEKQGTLVHYLKKHTSTNMVYLATSATVGAKRAELSYRVLEDLSGIISLVEIKLTTGRSHQIRTQFQAIGNPVFGDVRYGGDKLSKGHNIALWAVSLAFYHPVTKERLVFMSYPPTDNEPWKKYSLNQYLDFFKNTD